jgi:hypothetical protein
MKWSIRRAAREFGVVDETIARGLGALGIRVTRGKTFTTRQIFTAIAGDLRHERTREARARADLLELDRRERLGELMTIERAADNLRETLTPIRQSILAAPATLAAKCNPSDPHMAREIIEQWVDDTLRSLRERKRDDGIPDEPGIIEALAAGGEVDLGAEA